jgi:hypothetical protein
LITLLEKRYVLIVGVMIHGDTLIIRLVVPTEGAIFSGIWFGHAALATALRGE